MKTIIKLIAVIAFMSSPSLLLGTNIDPDAVFQEANQQYRDGNYEQAAHAYQSMLPEYQSAQVHYNLGNTYYELGDYGPAILHYKKALALDPRNPDIRANLELTQEAAQLTPPPPSWTAVIANQAPVNRWAWLWVISFWTTVALIIIAPMYRWRGPLRGGLTALAIVSLTVSGAALYGWHVNGSMGVVLSDKATLNVAPSAASPPAGSVKAGQVARIQKRHGDFYLVTLDDKVGWLGNESFAPVWD